MKQSLFIMMMILSSNVFGQSQVGKLSSQEQKMIMQYREHLKAVKRADTLYDLAEEEKAPKSLIEVETTRSIDELRSDYKHNFRVGHTFLGISATTGFLSLIPASKGNVDATTALYVVSGLSATMSMIFYIIAADQKSDYIIALSQGRVYF